MTRTVVFDVDLSAWRTGTGVATYARNLVLAARASGFEAHALVSTDADLDPACPIPLETLVRRLPSRSRPRWLEPVKQIIKGLIRAPFGYRPEPFGYCREPFGCGSALPRDGAAPSGPRPQVLPSKGEPGETAELPSFDLTYVENRLFHAARVHFYVYGRLAKLRLSRGASLFHATYPLPVRVAGCPNIVTIHDLVPLRQPQMTLDNKRYFYRLIRKLVTESDHIITVSEFSRRDIISMFDIPESRITNTHQAVALPPAILERSEDDVANEVRALFGLEYGEFFLFAGALEPKKNVSALIDAYAASGSRRPLVISGGKGWQNEADLRRINDPMFSDNGGGASGSKDRRVRRLPYLPFGQHMSLLRSARALLFPSLFEGFGLPVLEAMSLGTPVMTSNVTSLPEIAGEAALLVNPRDVSAMAAAIRRLDNDSSLLHELSRRGRSRAADFSMAKYQVRLREVYDRVIG